MTDIRGDDYGRQAALGANKENLANTQIEKRGLARGQMRNFRK